MATCTKIVILCYLLLYPHYSIAFDHVTIVNKDTIDKEFDNNIYQKNLFQPTSYLNAGYGTLYEHIGTVYQNVHTALFDSWYENTNTQRHSSATSKCY